MANNLRGGSASERTLDDELAKAFPARRSERLVLAAKVEVWESGRWHRGVINLAEDAVYLAWRSLRQVRTLAAERSQVAGPFEPLSRSHGAWIMLYLGAVDADPVLLRCRRYPWPNALGWGVRLDDRECGIGKAQLRHELQQWRSGLSG